MTHEYEPQLNGPASASYEAIVSRGVLINTIRQRFNVARRYQAGLVSAADEHSQPTVGSAYVHVSFANEAVPAPHDRIVLVPQLREDVVDGIISLTACIPTPSSSLNPDRAQAASSLEDVFLELGYENPGADQPRRFLLNSNGLIAYNTSADLQETLSADARPVIHYEISHPLPHAAEEMADSLGKVLDGAYRFSVQADSGIA